MAEQGVILCIDQGTTGSTALVLDRELTVLARENQEFPQIYPQPGWVEHDPEEIWQSVEASVTRALSTAGVSATDMDQTMTQVLEVSRCTLDSNFSIGS